MRRLLIVLLIVVLVVSATLWLGLAARQRVADLWHWATGEGVDRRATAETTDRLRGEERVRVLDVEVLEMTPQLRHFFGVPEDNGVLLAAVSRGGPAAAAGLAPGDVVTRFAGRRIGSVGDLARALAAEEDEVEVELYRRGERRRLTVEPETRVARRPYLRFRDGDLFDLAERMQEVGERAGILGELGGVADGVASLDVAAVARALDDAVRSLEGSDSRSVIEGLDARLEGLEERLTELESLRRSDADETTERSRNGRE